MPNAARLTDMHTCPMQTPGLPPVPHVGGPIIGPGVPTVLIGKTSCSRYGRHGYLRWAARHYH